MLIACTLLIGIGASAHACEPVTFASHRFSAEQSSGWQVDIENALTLTFPTLPTRIEKLGNLLSVRFADGSVAGLTTRTIDELSAFGEAANDGVPAFWRRVFTAGEAIACEVSASMRLAEQDYRIRFSSHGFDVYAFGTNRRHEFYAIARSADGNVIHGIFTDMPRARFETILSTVTTQDE